MIKLVLVRHGQSFWNLQNKFTGWTDVGLSQKGVEEAILAGQLLQKNEIKPKVAFLSMLLRAQQTFEGICKTLGKIKNYKSWKLNERHYGALQGLNKKQTAEQYGEEQVRIWRRSFAVRPPMLDEQDNRNPKFDELYEHVKEPLPLGESLQDTLKRVIEYFENSIKKNVESNSTALIVAHGNSLRALVMHLDGLTPEQVEKLEIPTGKPIVYELDDNFVAQKHYYLDWLFYAQINDTDYQ